MQIDHDYLKRLLEAFQAAPRPVTDINELQCAGIACDDQFVFHMGVLHDKGFIEREDGEPGFGILSGIGGLDGEIVWMAASLRLTADGHEFLEALHDKRVWAVIKDRFKSAGIDTLAIVGKTLLETYTKQALGGS